MKDLYRYDSLSAAYDAARRPPKFAGNQAAHSTDVNTGHGQSFSGTPRPDMTLEDVQAWFDVGSAEIAARIERQAADLVVPRMTSVRRRGVWTDQGDAVDMDRVRAGALDIAWRTTRKVRVSAPTRVRVVCDVAANCGTVQDRLAWRGVAALALTKALTAAGYTVAVDAGMCIQSVSADKKWSPTIVTSVKTWGAPLSLSSLGAAFGTAAWFRRIGFALLSGLCPSELNLNYGYPRSFDSLAQEVYGDEPGTTRVVVPASVLSEQEARAWLAQTVADLERGAAA